MNTKGTAYALSCPSCGAGMECGEGQKAVNCVYCGRTVVVSPRVAGTRAFAPDDEPPLPARVEKLVREGHDGRAVLLLRERLSLSLSDAGRVVELIRMDESADAVRLIEDAQNGKLN